VLNKENAAFDSPEAIMVGGRYILSTHPLPSRTQVDSTKPSCFLTSVELETPKMNAIWNTVAAYQPLTMPLLSWRTVAVVFALANLKSLHFMWFVRPPTSSLPFLPRSQSVTRKIPGRQRKTNLLWA
jgi:hypothetical protein